MRRCASLVAVVSICGLFIGCGGQAPTDLDSVLPDSEVEQPATTAADVGKEDSLGTTAAQSLQAGPVDGDVPAPGGINSAEPAGQPVPEIGIPVSLEVVTESTVDADVIVRFLINDIEVHRTEWRALSGDAPMTIGPELATRIDVTGSYTDGTALSPAVLVAEQDFEANDVVGYTVVDPIPAAPGTVSGIVRNAASATALSGIDVTLFLGETPVASGTTGPTGTFELVAPSGTGNYHLVVSGGGFIEEIYTGIEIVEGGSSFLQPIPLVEAGDDDVGGIGGHILNALDGSPVGGLTIVFRRGVNNTSGSIAAETMSDSAGAYSVAGLPAGAYTGEVSGSGFITTHFIAVCLAGTITGNQDASVTPVLMEGQTRIVLSWGERPRDLDSHLTGPSLDGGRFHVYFGDQTYETSGIVYAELDLDDVSSFGPETTSIYHQVGGVYRFLVHDFTNGGSTSSTALSASGATVKVFQGSSLVATFSVPGDEGGTLWTVFELQGTAITPINTMSFEYPSNSSRPTSPQDPEAALFLDLPEK